MNEVSYLKRSSMRDLTEYLMEDESQDIEGALEALANSSTLEKLLDSRTGLYLCGSAHVYEYLKDELSGSSG